MTMDKSTEERALRPATARMFILKPLLFGMFIYKSIYIILMKKISSFFSSMEIMMYSSTTVVFSN